MAVFYGLLAEFSVCKKSSQACLQKVGLWTDKWFGELCYLLQTSQTLSGLVGQ